MLLPVSPFQRRGWTAASKFNFGSAVFDIQWEASFMFIVIAEAAT